ncbi:unnamed protein product [Fusarium venenatum]|uniref:Uncharacterized protein n=1 Tax=Fusarium venenatum TaxID=56646 RepID=A0A2L2TC92_9HYPO|nr:LOW QUALITY PROTEIN: uncharacterized protein FVRRES_04071 [Fusarium venenatum]CEI67559.1 unnamed protein product [Fusarium venenatum]
MAAQVPKAMVISTTASTAHSSSKFISTNMSCPLHVNFKGCPATEAGFEKETDLKNHTRRWHP